MQLLNLTLVTFTFLSPLLHAQEYIGMKTTSRGDCKLYRERLVVDSRKFSDDLKKQVAYREKLIEMGKEKVAALASSTKTISQAMLAVEQVEDETQGHDLIWTFEYCAYDRSVNDENTKVLGKTGVAQKVYGNPDDTYTIESPRVLHAGQVYHLETPYYVRGDSGLPEEKLLFKSICQHRFGFKTYISHSNTVQSSPTVRLGKEAYVTSVDVSGHPRNVIKQLTCK